jgi:hypothetical protein
MNLLQALAAQPLTQSSVGQMARLGFPFLGKNKDFIKAFQLALEDENVSADPILC